MELFLVLGTPLLGTSILAILGARRYAPEVNVGVSLATLLAAPPRGKNHSQWSIVSRA